MAYFTGRDVRLWITTEHSDDGVRMDGTAQTNQLITYPDADAGSVDINAVITGLDAAGKASWQLSDITGVDVSVSAQDEDISFMGLRNVGKIEVKKDTSVSITRKKSDVKFAMLFQGKTKVSSDGSRGDGRHGARHGLIGSLDGLRMEISDGTTDPKSTLDDSDSQCFGYRVFVELKAESSADAGDGEVLVIPNCMFTEYGHTISNESANEETFSLASQVKPFIYNGTKSGGVYTGNAVAQTATNLM